MGFKNPVAHKDDRLRPYQQQGVRFIRRSQDGAILYWDMGTGKTRTALLCMRRFRRMVIVAPKVTQGVWAEEVQAVYGGHEMLALSGREYEDLPEDEPIIWMNYEIVQGKWSWFQDHPIDVLILDEGHYIQNKRSQRTQAVHALTGCSKKVIVLTGTPIWNRPRSLWSLVTAVEGAEEWGSYYDFVRHYCDGAPTGYGGYRADGLSRRHLRELQGRLEGVIHRVRWQDVSDVPKLDRHRLPVILTQKDQRAYQRLERDVRKILDGYEGTASPSKAVQLRRITQMRLMVGRAKVKPTVDFIATIPDDEKVVIWAHHHEVMEAIADKLSRERVAMIHGKQTAKKQRAQLRYFRDRARFIILSLEAGSVGIDLTDARIAIWAELSWTPAILAQSERRTWRSTQQRACQHYYPTAQGTVEDRIFDLLEQKVRLTYDALDDGELLAMMRDIGPKREEMVKSIVSAIQRS